jgi:hypothetical protein
MRSRLISFEQQLTSRLAGTWLAAAVKPVLMRRYLSRPFEVDIEVTSSCDADCIMCPRRSMHRRVGPMPFDLFQKIVDECVELGVQRIVVNGYGEISTLRNQRDYLKYIREKSSKVKIVVNTNGMRMTEAVARTYVEMPVDVVNIAIDGATAPTFESIRRHLKLDVVENNVRQLVRIRDEAGARRPLVIVQMILMPQNHHEEAAFLAKWDGVVDRVAVVRLVSRGGSIPVRGVDDKGWDRTPCFLLWSQMPILSDGTVAMCCDDWDGTSGLGTLRERSLKETWTSAAHRRLQQTHLDGGAATMPLCDGCRLPRVGPWWFAKTGH